MSMHGSIDWQFESMNVYNEYIFTVDVYHKSNETQLSILVSYVTGIQ